MKKKRVIEEVICDFCKNFSNTKCKVCGKDVCNNCARYLCKYNAPPEHTRSPWSQSDTYSYKQTYEPVLNEALCPSCCEAFKITIGVTAGMDRVDQAKVKKEAKDAAQKVKDNALSPSAEYIS